MKAGIEKLNGNNGFETPSIPLIQKNKETLHDFYCGCCCCTSCTAGFGCDCGCGCC